MAIRVCVELDDGMPVVCHRADAADAPHLQEVAERLHAAQLPGVVAVRRSGPDADGWTLVTEHGGPALGAGRDLTPWKLAAVAADVAGTLAALHERGIVHGRVTPQRIRVGADGSGVLCGLGSGVPAAGPADDVAALGAVIAELADGSKQGGIRGPGPATVVALLAIAARARHEPPSRRPPARRLAQELRALAAPAPKAGPRLPGARRPARALALGMAGTLAGTLAVVNGVGDHRRPEPVEPPTAHAPTAPTHAPARPSCVARQGHPVVAPTCAHRVVVEGPAVVVDGSRLVVGRPGDEVVVADWACAGTLRAAVLRPSTGEVLVLEPRGRGEGPAVAAARRVEGATGLDPRADGAGGPALLVTTANGRAEAFGPPDGTVGTAAPG